MKSLILVFVLIGSTNLALGATQEDADAAKEGADADRIGAYDLEDSYSDAMNLLDVDNWNLRQAINQSQNMPQWAKDIAIAGCDTVDAKIADGNAHANNGGAHIIAADIAYSSGEWNYNMKFWGAAVQEYGDAEAEYFASYAHFNLAFLELGLAETAYNNAYALYLLYEAIW